MFSANRFLGSLGLLSVWLVGCVSKGDTTIITEPGAAGASSAQGGASQNNQAGGAGSGGTSSGGSAPGAATSPAKFSKAIGADSSCSSCITTSCEATTGKCDKNPSCLAVLDQIQVEREFSPTDGVNCWVAHAVAAAGSDAQVDANLFATCVSQNCSSMCGALQEGVPCNK